MALSLSTVTEASLGEPKTLLTLKDEGTFERNGRNCLGTVFSSKSVVGILLFGIRNVDCDIDFYGSQARYVSESIRAEFGKVCGERKRRERNVIACRAVERAFFYYEMLAVDFSVESDFSKLSASGTLERRLIIRVDGF